MTTGNTTRRKNAMNECNPDMVKAWNDYIGPWLSGMNPEEALPLWNAFKAGWDARFKHDLAMEKQHDL